MMPDRESRPLGEPERPEGPDGPIGPEGPEWPSDSYAEDPWDED